MWFDCERINEFYEGQKVLDYKGNERTIKCVLDGTARGLFQLEDGELVFVCQIEKID